MQDIYKSIKYMMGNNGARHLVSLKRNNIQNAEIVDNLAQHPLLRSSRLKNLTKRYSEQKPISNDKEKWLVEKKCS